MDDTTQFNPDVSVASQVRYTHKSYPTDLKTILSSIKKGRYNKSVTRSRWAYGNLTWYKTTYNPDVDDPILKELKGIYRESKSETLPCFFANGSFKTGKTIANSTIETVSGILIIDIDHFEDAGLDLETARADLITKEHIVFCFVSPSGDGLKLGFRYDISTLDPDNFGLQCYAQIRNIFEGWGYKLDESGKDVRRACFFSHDPKLYFNGTAKPFALIPYVAPVKPAKPAQIQHQTTHDSYGSMSESELVALLKCFPQDIDRDIWFTVLQGLHNQDVGLLDLANDWSSTIAGYVDYADVVNTWTSLGKNTAKPVTMGTVVHMAKQYQKPKLVWLDGDALADTATAAKFLINNILETESHGLLSGKSGAFKSFLALDIAHSVCTGNPFMDNKVFKSGKVLYICGEGQSALSRRIKALKLKKGDFSGNFFVLESTFQMDSPPDLNALKEYILAVNPILVIFDTFSSLAYETDESSNPDVARCLKLVKDTCNGDASSIIVHHYGKDTSRGSRGASAFTNNVDFEFSMVRNERDHNAIFGCIKQKDHEEFAEIHVKSVPVLLGIANQDGSESYSLVLEKDKIPLKETRGKNEQIAFDLLNELLKSDKSVTPTEKIIGTHNDKKQPVLVVKMDDWKQAFIDVKSAENGVSTLVSLKKYFRTEKDKLFKKVDIDMDKKYVWLSSS